MIRYLLVNVKAPNFYTLTLSLLPLPIVEEFYLQTFSHSLKYENAHLHNDLSIP